MRSFCSKKWNGIMKLLDVNIWLALSVDTHNTALDWFAEQKETSSLHFCRATQQGYIRLITTAAVMKGYGYEPHSNPRAWSAYEGFLADLRIAFAPEPTALEETWKSFALRKTSSPKLWMDAYLAAFAVCSGYYQLVTADKAFTQFKGLEIDLLQAD